MTSPDITSRLSTTGQLLVRSGIEIGRLLDAMAQDRSAVTAQVPPQLLFLSQLLYVEPVRGYMMLSYSDHKPANSAALSARSLTFRCNHRGAQFAFTGDGPRQSAHKGQPCIQCALPSAVLGMQRRGAGRVQVPAQAPVSCDLRMGLISFPGRVVDVSLDGIGTLVTDPAIPLCAGTRLERVRISHPQCTPFLIDFEIRYVTRVVLANGEHASRIGCQVVGARERLEELIRLFIIDLA
ncbi:MAG TPA: flagellar regulator YcgR PilZN domain-containing protein [Burkholderiales bacterium]|nr:flagellar regulator YcgR PilZN domain-containing protein [Burkholderiales bacterium]